MLVSTCACFNLCLFQLVLVSTCACLLACRYTGGSGAMECVVVLCLLSGEWWPVVVCVRLAEHLLSDVHLSSLAFSVLVEGQVRFTAPSEDNKDLGLGAYRAASSFVLLCTYREDGATSIDYTWTKDGNSFEHTRQTIGNGGTASVQAIVSVPNGDYLSSKEGTYTCSVRVAGTPRGSRNIIVTLPGKPSMHHTYLSHTQSASVVSISW